MAADVKITFRGFLQGVGGHTTAGVSKSNKVLVTGEFNVTSYTASGEPLSAADLGLSTIDSLTFDVRTVNDAATVPASGAIPMAAYDQTGSRVIINIDHGADTAVTTGQDAVLKFIAIGDSAQVADLT
jgi:hypothetical protein